MIIEKYNHFSTEKVFKMLEIIKKTRKEFAVLLDLKDIEGIRNSNEFGHIYLVINENIPGWIKCGMTSNIIGRLHTYNCGDPLNRYKILIEKIVSNKGKSEKLLMYELGLYAFEKQGEWFRINEDEALKIFEKI